jgi:hypothetical protein
MCSYFFSNKCYFGNKTLTPWRNPCHSQGLIYKRCWIRSRLFRIDVGPLADLIHTYKYKVYKNCIWIVIPISIFYNGGASNNISYKLFSQCRFGVLINCNNFNYSVLWIPISYAIYSSNYIYRLIKYLYNNLINLLKSTFL